MSASVCRVENGQRLTSHVIRRSRTAITESNAGRNVARTSSCNRAGATITDVAWQRRDAVIR